MHHLLNRRAGLGALVTGALLASLALAPAAPAATIKACQKKKGGALRIITGKAKCKKKTEKTLSWSTTGPAGKNGANGTNGTNGASGAIGATGPQGPGAKRFTGNAAITLLSNEVAVQPFTVGPVTISFNCGNFLVGNAAVINISSTADGLAATQAVYAENPDNAIDVPQTVFASDAFTAGQTKNHNVALAGGDATNNPSIFTTVVESGGQTLIITGAVALSSSCTISGQAIPATG